MQPRHRRRVVDRAVEGPPEEKLVDTAKSTVRIAADQIDIERFEIARRIGLARDDAVAEILDVRGKDRLDPVGEFFPHRFGPAAAGRRGNLSGSVAFDHARRFRQLQPEDRVSGRAAARVERRRLADADGRRRRQHAALGLVGGFRHTVEPRREMDERDRAKLCRLPFRRRLQRVVDLHIAFAVAVLRERLGHLSWQPGVGEQPSVKLRGRDRADDALRSLDLLAAREPHAAGAFAADEDALDIGIEQDFTALIVDQARERSKRAARAPLGDRCAGGFEREGDDLAHLARISALRAETGVQHPWRKQRADDLGLVAGLEPAARGAERFAEEIRKLAQAAAPDFARHDLEHGPRPQRAAEQREQERSVGAHPVDVGGKARAVAVGELVEGRDIRLAVHGEDRMPAVGQQHRGRGRRMREGKAALL